MGTISARDCLRILDLTSQVTAALLIAVRQGVTLRGRVAGLHLTSALGQFVASLNAEIPFIEEDRALDGDLRSIMSSIAEQRWPLYA